MGQILMFLTTFIIQFIIATEMNLIAPLAPFLSGYFGIKDSSVILFNLGYSAVGILVPFLGVLADRHGKKRALSLSLLIFMFGTILASFSNTPLLFGLSRVFIGLGYFSLSGTNLSYIAEYISYENRGKASGVLRIAFGIAILTSPIYATTLINKYNNVASVYIPLTILALIAFLLLFMLPETEKKKDVKISTKDLFELLKEPKNSKMFLSLFLILTAPLMLMSFFGVYLSNEFNLSQGGIGLAYTIVAVGTLLGILLSAIISDKLGKLKTTKLLFSIMVLALIPLPYVKSLPLLIGLATLFAFGLDGGWTAYQAFASEITPENRGTFMSLFYTVNALTVMLYSLIGSIIYGIGGFNLAVAMGTVFSALALYIIIRMKN